MVRVGRFLLVLLFAVALLTSSQSGSKTEIAQAQTDPVEIYSCDQLLGKIQTVSNGAAVIEAIDNCTIVNNKIRAVIRFKTETCAIFNQLPYCQNSPTDIWMSYVQSSGRNAIAGILKNPEPTGLYMRKCQNTEYDPWPPGDGITWTCKRDRSVNQQQTSQTITDRAWLTISPKPKITIAADETSVSWGEPFFNLTWESQFAETVYLEMSADGDNWQQYQGYGFQLTPPGGGNQSVNGGQQGGNASDFVHRFFRTKASNTYNQGQSQNSPPGYSNLLDIIIGPIAVSLKATPSGILAGQSSVLSWKSRGASTLTIDNGIGGVAVPSGSKAVTPPQTTTYVITAKGQTGVMATANAKVSVGLPDLVPDLSQAYMEITLYSDAKFTVAMNQLPVGYGTDVKLMTLKNVKVKNIGVAPSSGMFNIGLNPYLEMADTLGRKAKHGSPFCMFSISRQDTIAPGGSIAADIPIKGGEYGICDYEFAKLAEQGVSRDYLYVFIDRFYKIAESNEDNNVLRIDNYFAWSTIKANVVGEFSGGGSDFLNKVVAVFRNTSSQSANNVKYATVGSDRIAYLTPTESIYSGIKVYEVWGQIGGRDATGAHLPVPIANYSVYNAGLALNQGVMIFLEIFQDYLYPDEWDDTLDVTSGKVTLENKATHQRYDFNSKNSVVFINLGEIPSGDYALISAEGKYSERNGNEFKAMPLKAKYPETSRSRLGNGRSMPINWPQNIKISDNGSSFIVGESAQMVLAKGCIDLPRPTSVNICIYGDSDTRDRVVNNVLPAAKDQIGRLKGFRSGASALKRIIFSPYPQSPGGYYSPGVSDAYFLLTYRASPVQPSISVHEIFHFIDGHNLINGKEITDNPDYQRSVKEQFSTQTGKRIWDIAVRPNSYNDSGYGYTAEMLIINRGAAYKYDEVFAEEMTSSCLYQKLLTERLTNIESYWRTYYGSQPPSNLRSQRDNALNRIKGIVKDANGRQVIIPQIASYFEQCGR